MYVLELQSQLDEAEIQHVALKLPLTEPTPSSPDTPFNGAGACHLRRVNDNASVSTVEHLQHIARWETRDHSSSARPASRTEKNVEGCRGAFEGRERQETLYKTILTYFANTTTTSTFHELWQSQSRTPKA